MDGSTPMHARLRPAVAAPSGARVVLAEFDLFQSLGGGQSVYQGIIAQRPDDLFHYFRRHEAANAPRPANAIAIPYAETYGMDFHSVPERLHNLLSDYLTARNMAASAASLFEGRHVDVVDVPDYLPIAMFIRPAFRRAGIAVGTVALAMHGTLSAAFRGAWPTGLPEGRLLAEMRVREHLQFRTADVRYAISAPYAERWRRYADLPVHLVDPLCVLHPKTTALPMLSARSTAAPDLVFIGRQEKLKGPDLFLDLAWAIDPALYGRLVLAGPNGPNRLGGTGAAALTAMAARRRLHADRPGALSRDEMRAVFERRSLLLLPSRIDTFNLVAFEALHAGCPTIVSDQAGVASWIRRHLPELDWLVVSVDCSRAAAGAVAKVLADYDRHREQLVNALRRAAPRPDWTTLDGMYEAASVQDARARQVVIDLAQLLEPGIVQRAPPSMRQVAAGRLAGFGRALLQRSGLPAALQRLPEPVRNAASLGGGAARVGMLALRRGRRSHAVRDAALAVLRPHPAFQNRAGEQVLGALRLPGRPARLARAHERTTLEIDAKLAALSARVPDGLVDRVPLFEEMSRLERRRGQPLIAATYALRVMRWLGADRRGELPFVVQTLNEAGFPHEAATAHAMFAPATPAERDACCEALLRDAIERNRAKPVRELAVLDDRRGGATPRVAVIASLYNAAEKLPTLLAMLAQQTIVQRGELEVVLIDSNSPADEHGAFAAFAAAHDLPIVYGRSAGRETIQAAWNRGIHLAHAPYLAFLGADEGLQPDALRQLAAVLDADRRVDWAMADSIVTDVDRHGVYANDIMAYDRAVYRQDLVYLDTTYLSWVGGLYRRDLHDRFGFYDETFRAAGDTEFKCRLLPSIRSLHIPRPLGIFNNYPEARTTQSPRAEIEDLRAWYLWRTPAGMRHAFGARPAADVLGLIRASLAYRKSFCGHTSTDVDVADAAAAYLATRPDAPAALPAMRAAIAEALAMLRGAELLAPAKPSRWPLLDPALRARQHLRHQRELAAAHRSIIGLDRPPAYEGFNDNRYEQHWWSWST